MNVSEQTTTTPISIEEQEAGDTPVSADGVHTSFHEQSLNRPIPLHYWQGPDSFLVVVQAAGPRNSIGIRLSF